jgi:cytochrome c5
MLRFPRLLWVACFALPAACLAIAAAPPPDLQRGRGLYELRCDGCHSESVHGRAHRVARDRAEIRAWVRRWNDHLRLGWGDDEIEDVAAWLDATYYHFPCDTPACRAVSLAPASPR